MKPTGRGGREVGVPEWERRAHRWRRGFAKGCTRGARGFERLVGRDRVRGPGEVAVRAVGAGRW